MTYYLGTCLGLVAPYYNLVLVAIVVALFIKLFKTPNKKAYIVPWKFLFFSTLVYILEEILTVLHSAGIISISNMVNPFLEMAIITSFIYMLLLQKIYICNTKKK